MTTDAPVIHIVDDDDSFRTAVARVLKASGYQVMLYDSANSLLDSLPKPDRGCILLDVRMPGISGPQLQEMLASRGYALPIIFMTGHGDIATSVRAIKTGAEDFLSKPVARDTLLDAVDRALKHYDDAHERAAQLNSFRELVSTLTPRENQVFGLVVRGRLNKQIAHELGTAERTIKAHRHSIMRKLQVQSLAELVSIAERLRMLSGPNGH